MVRAELTARTISIAPPETALRNRVKELEEQLQNALAEVERLKAREERELSNDWVPPENWAPDTEITNAVLEVVSRMQPVSFFEMEREVFHSLLSMTKGQRREKKSIKAAWKLIREGKIAVDPGWLLRLKEEKE